MLTAKLGKKGGQPRYFEFLIDSGSDYTIIPQSDAAILGVNYKELSTKEIEIHTANLTTMHGKEARMILTIGKFDLNIPVLIIKEEVERLLGRKGVFSEFEITFKERNNTVVFKKS